jgi:peroxiredoxin
MIRDARIDQAAHKNHEAFWEDPQSAFPFRLISDRENLLAGKVGAVRDKHWAGPMVHPTTYLVDSGGIVRWRFQSKMAQRRPSPVLLAAIAGAVAKKQPLPEYIED